MTTPRIWDISEPIEPTSATFPGDTPFTQEWVARQEAEDLRARGCTVSTFDLKLRRADTAPALRTHALVSLGWRALWLGRFDEAQAQLKGAYSSATTRRTFTKERAAKVEDMPLLYSLQGLWSGVTDVIHDLSWHEWLIDANRLMRSEEFDRLVRSRYGDNPNRLQQFHQFQMLPLLHFHLPQQVSTGKDPHHIGLALLSQRHLRGNPAVPVHPRASHPIDQKVVALDQ